MLLYEDKKNKIGIYEFVPKNMYDFFEYKTDELKKVDDEEKIYYAESRIGSYSDPVFSKNMIKIKNSDFLDSEVDCDDEALERRALISNPYYNRLLISKRNHKNLDLLEKYIHGNFESSDVVRIKYPNLLKYFLLTEAYLIVDNEYDFDEKLCIMKNIIQLPESLYKLQLLENGNFEKLSGEDYSEQLDLFTLNQLDEIDKETVRKMDLYRIGNQSFYKTMQKVENDTKKLQLIKK